MDCDQFGLYSGCSVHLVMDEVVTQLGDTIKLCIQITGFGAMRRTFHNRLVAR